MKNNKKNEKKFGSITAGEFIKQQRAAGKYDNSGEWERKAIEEFNEASKAVRQEFINLGISLDSINDFNKADLYQKENREGYNLLSKIFIKWIPRLENLRVKEFMVRFLSVPWESSATARAFVNEFKKYSGEEAESYKWAIGNALSIFATDEIFDELLSIVQEKKHGTPRQMALLALVRMKNPHHKEHAIDVLINLLSDDDVAGHALNALCKLNAKRARKYILPFLHHENTYWRNEAKKVIAKFDKSQ